MSRFTRYVGESGKGGDRDLFVPTHLDTVFLCAYLSGVSSAVIVPFKRCLTVCVVCDAIPAPTWDRTRSHSRQAHSCVVSQNAPSRCREYLTLVYGFADACVPSPLPFPAFRCGLMDMCWGPVPVSLVAPFVSVAKEYAPPPFPPSYCMAWRSSRVFPCLCNSVP